MYVEPTHELLGPPKREWDDERKCYIRRHCSYCTHDTYKSTEEAVTGRYFCGICVARNGWPILEIERIDELRTR